jgi:type I restriction enzyme R subunit
VKKVAKTLLEKLKQGKLVLDWREQQMTSAIVRVTIKEVLEHLTRAFTKELYEPKYNVVHQHFYEEYTGPSRTFLQ